MVRGASGDECGELIGGKGTIGLKDAVPKKPHTRLLTLTFGRHSTEIGKLASVEYSYRACRLPSYPSLRSVIVINMHSY